MGLLGASLFTTGILFSITPMVIAGICLTALVILGMLLLHLYGQRSATQVLSQSPPSLFNPVAYSSNNMNTMKRNKSDTDLELINRQSEED